MAPVYLYFSRSLPRSGPASSNIYYIILILQTNHLIMSSLCRNILSEILKHLCYVNPKFCIYIFRLLLLCYIYSGFFATNLRALCGDFREILLSERTSDAAMCGNVTTIEGMLLTTVTRNGKYKTSIFRILNECYIILSARFTSA
jgi:hypothetical protein